MKKLISMIGVAVLLTGCSGSFNIQDNPDETNFDQNYQGSPDIDLENADMVEEEVIEEEEVTETGTGEVVEEAAEETGTGEVATEEVGTGEVVTEEEVVAPETDATGV